MFVLGEKEVAYLNKVFASFGYKDADIKKVEEENLLLSSFAVNTAGESIVPYETESLFNVDICPHFCILSKKDNVLRLDFCMSLELVSDYVISLYMDDSYDDLGVYFIKGETGIPETVEFAALIHYKEESISVENFGVVKSGEISDRAIEGAKSNLPLKQYFKEPVEVSNLRVEEFYLNNILDLRLNKDGFDTDADAYRFATSIEELAAFMDALKGDKVVFYALIGNSKMNIETAADAAEEFEDSRNYWRGIYEEGLEA